MTGGASPVIALLALLLVAAVGLIVAIVTGVLAKAGGANLAQAILSAGTAFGGTFGLGLAVLCAVHAM
jgi:hypothetical protein